MRWLEVAVPSHPEAVEAVSEILDRVGYNGIAVEVPLDPAEQHIVKAYLVYDHAARVKVRRVKEAIGRLRAFGLGPVGEVALRRIRDEDWLEAWKAQFGPIRIGPFFIRPSWSDAAAAETTIVLDPGMAFGTGLHPTTRQCLEALGERTLKGRSVLDVGTGSGILAIAAAKRGARPVVGVDTDPLAVRAATENAARNDVRVDVRAGSAADVEGRYELVVANLVAEVLVPVAPELRARLASGGTVIVAGIVAEKEQGVIDAFAAAGLAVAGRDQQDDWVRLDLR
ncbi:MAG: ribosomal protein L11 methyltransferase [Chloroflexi bacterium RIFCSPLOWO2_12_FULL_71_12]|nr:MAG: ribosomal protein L11 methyltransferase [Chloroflexi bacterium GWC2_70_10]OGO70552.1 MAG: ribosomal protein L11 methyltransferase [Chloroflexi bacterium RIFCSPLOWO2_02_FULL_71_16]OGO73559.1 MAG: ribosomal protein L11 methyltransferase [Chloroflexi bacterium RIFCSPLOWO2_12_FULL_71_12]